MEELRQELNYSSTKYQAAMPHQIKYLLCEITYIVKILTRHLQDHQLYPSTALNLNPGLKSEAYLIPHRFQTSNNHMADNVTPPASDVSRTKTSSSGVRITEKMNINTTMFFPSGVCFATKTTKQDKTPYLSAISTLQVGQAVTHIDSNGSCLQATIAKVTNFHHIWWSNVPHWNHSKPISPGKYLFPRWTLRYQYVPHQHNYPASPCQHRTKKKPATNIGFYTHCHTPVTTNAYPFSPVDQHLQFQFQPDITGRQHIVDSTTDNIPLLE